MEAILRMHRAAWGPVSEEWFAWLYEDLPYTSRVPIVVAEHEGEVVGARPFLPLPVTLDGSTTTGLMLVNLVVDADHRRKGLFSRMSERTYRFAVDHDDVTFTFTYASDAARRGLAKLEVPGTAGPVELGRFSKAHRFQRFTPFYDAVDSSMVARGVRVAEPVARTCLGILDGRQRRRLRDVDVDVVVDHSVPAARLARLADDHYVTGTVGPERDEAFYRWRFAAPHATFTTYFAVVGDRPIGAMVTARRKTADDRRLEVSEVVVADCESPETVLSVLLDAVLNDNDDLTQLTVATDDLPRSLLERCGFVVDTSFPFSRVTERPTFMVRLTDGDDSLDEAEHAQLRSSARWRHSYTVRSLG